MFKNKSILITGGTGSFGKKFAASLLNKFKDIYETTAPGYFKLKKRPH